VEKTEINTEAEPITAISVCHSVGKRNPDFEPNYLERKLNELIGTQNYKERKT